MVEPSKDGNYKLPLNLIIIPLKDLVVFPTMIINVFIRSSELIKAVETAIANKELVGLLTEKDSKGKANKDNLYQTGTTVTVLQIIKNSDTEAMLLAEGISRFKAKKITQDKPFYRADIAPVEQADPKDIKLQASIQEIKDLIKKMSEEGKELPPEFLVQLSTLNDIDSIADLACSFLSAKNDKKQELLAMNNHAERLAKIIDLLNKEVQLLKIRKKIKTDISQELNKSERDFYLRQELKAIKKELGDDKDNGIMGLEGMTDEADIKDLSKRIKDSAMPKDVLEIANKELDRLKKILPISPEYTVARTYIEWLCDMPWNKTSQSQIDVKKAREILDEDHYGLEKVKERILEFLAICQLNKNYGSTILCFVGPPGVGKTSLGKSVARSLGRAFVHTSLGGMRDEADIRGHRRTYVGAMPGRIIQSLKRAECNDPVFMLDEIDKMGKDFQGDPAAALLEALDPEQNFAFTDHYMDIPYDLSKVFFILTANFLDPIPPALLDRMEIIELPGYTEEEKLQITKKYLLPKQLISNGLEKKKSFAMTDEAIYEVIRSYTYEAGLRELERQIATICRKVAKDMIEKKKNVKKVDVKQVKDYLGVEKYFFEEAQEEDMVGVATGLAWTPYGGDIIFIESTKMKGSKNLILTGNLGDVMQESARAALSYIKSNAKKFDVNDSIFEKTDIHIHVPEGATPKDGPSAGITMCTSLISLLTGRKVRRDVAMTGEVTLTGRILPIGGLKEKLLAAKRARMKTVIMPAKNKKDLVDIPKKIIKDLKIEFAENLDDVLKIALLPKSKSTPKQKDKKAAKTKKKSRKKNISIVKIKLPANK